MRTREELVAFLKSNLPAGAEEIWVFTGLAAVWVKSSGGGWAFSYLPNAFSWAPIKPGLPAEGWELFPLEEVLGSGAMTEPEDDSLEAQLAAAKQEVTRLEANIEIYKASAELAAQSLREAADERAELRAMKAVLFTLKQML